MIHDRYEKTKATTHKAKWERLKMNETVDDLSVSYFEDGVETVKQLDKIVLTKGAWATIIYRYQDWDQKKQAYSPDRYTIRRYQKKNGEYKQRSKFNISSADQAEKIIAALQQWLAVAPQEQEHVE